MPTPSTAPPPASSEPTIMASQDSHSMDYLDMVTVLAEQWRRLIAVPVAAGVIAYGLTLLVQPTFTAKSILLPPQQQQSSAASALASLGALSGLAGASLNIKSPADQYVSLMQSDTVLDRIIDRFQLVHLYKAEYRAQARTKLLERVRITLGKKDGLIVIEANAPNPQLAADLANSFVLELRRLTADLALTEAQQRRVFFEKLVSQAQDALTKAQKTLQASGFNAGALKAEPKAAADTFARMQAEITAADVKLQTLRRALTEEAPEVQQQLALLSALRGKLANAERNSVSNSDADYIGSYRDYKYQEALFDIFSKQYELARVDESRDGLLIQVVDPAQPPERRSAPKRSLVAAGVTVGSFFLLAFFFVCQSAARLAARDPHTAGRFKRLRSALSLKRSGTNDGGAG